LFKWPALLEKNAANNGHYRVGSKLGEGDGCGCRAHATRLGRDVAIKFCRTRRPIRAVARFEREARNARRTESPTSPRLRTSSKARW
jgi:hypothetical protein